MIDVDIRDLPGELLGEIAGFLSLRDQRAFLCTCKAIHDSPSVRDCARTLVVDGRRRDDVTIEAAVRSSPSNEVIRHLVVRNVAGFGSSEYGEDVKKRLSGLKTLTLRNVTHERTRLGGTAEAVRRSASLFVHAETLHSVTLAAFDDVDFVFLRALPDSVRTLHTYNLRNKMSSSADIGRGCAVIAEAFPRLESLVYDAVDFVRDAGSHVPDRIDAPVDAAPLISLRSLTHLSFPRVGRKVHGKHAIIAANKALQMRAINAASHRDYPMISRA